MSRFTKNAWLALFFAAIGLVCAGCVFWQLTADRTIAYAKIDQSVLYSVMTDNRLYLATNDGSSLQNIKILDISNPFDLKEIDAPGLAYLPQFGIDGIAVYNDSLIVNQGPLIIVIDAMESSNGQFKNELDFHDAQDTTTRCVVFGEYLIRFVSSDPDYFLAIKTYNITDIIESDDPAEASSLIIPDSNLNRSFAATVMNDILYIVAPPTFYIVDLSNISIPSEISSCPLPQLARAGNKLIVEDDKAYILPNPSPDDMFYGDSSESEGNAVIIDITNILEPIVVCSVEEMSGPGAVSGNYFLLKSGESIDVYDFTDYANVELVKTLNVRLALSAIHVLGDYAIVPEARMNQSTGVGTVLLAPYR